MSEVAALDGRTEEGLSQGARVVDAFFAPTKTFADIRRSASWWAPYLVAAVLGLLFAFVVLNKIGLPALIDGVVHQSPTLQDRMANGTPEQAEAMQHGMEWQFKFMYAGPVIFLVIGLIVSAIFLGTANFVFGGRATYQQMLAVWFYGTLPLAVISILTMVTVFAGISGDSFNIRNTVGTNVGFYLMYGDTPQWLVTLLSSVDIISIWAAVLLTMGIATVAKIARSSAAVVVFGWWAIWVLAQTAIVAITG